MEADHNQGGNEIQEEFWVLRCQAGDETAFRQLYFRYKPRTFAFLKGLVKGVEAEDLNQEVWLTVYRRITSLTNTNGFRMWLFQVARNRALDYFRQNKKLLELQEATQVAPEERGEEQPFYDGEDEELKIRLRACLEKLPQRHREVLILSFLEGMDYEEIGLITGCSIGTVKSRMHHAKMKLKYLINIKIGDDDKDE
ncbi:RNA polymerase sigma factor [Roseivirga sp.]|uniref:RNA polymerase sigma factor n=1 Tax=Roseivirga sp. TaxID=1964215 RepID=UPI002B26D8EB|nr:sigma-70 family RNA polymerase sigma factor [Roseivirga sp.]